MTQINYNHKVNEALAHNPAFFKLVLLLDYIRFKVEFNTK